MVIKDKKQFYQMYDMGLFGNRFRSWKSVDEFLESNFLGKVSLRYAGSYGGKFCQYNVKRNEVEDVVEQWVIRGAEKEKIKINESAPDDDLIWQGEIMRSADSYDLTYSYEKTKMRTALKNALFMRGVKVLHLLRQTLTPHSFDDLMELFDIYTESVIELSVYKYTVGCLPHRNAVIWEVRNY